MKKKNPAAGAPMSIRLAEDLKRDLEEAALKLKMDTHQVMRLAMEVGLEHFTRIDHNLARAVLEQSIAAQTSRHQKSSDASQLALVAESHAPNVTPLPPRMNVSYASGKKQPRKKNGTED